MELEYGSSGDVERFKISEYNKYGVLNEQFAIFKDYITNRGGYEIDIPQQHVIKLTMGYIEITNTLNYDYFNIKKDNSIIFTSDIHFIFLMKRIMKKELEL